MTQSDAHSLPVIDIDAHPPLCLLPVDHIGELDTETFFARLTFAGIDIACGRLTPPPGFFETHAPEEAIARLNRAALDLACVNARYLPALWIHPDCPDFSLSQLEEYAQSGVRLFEIDAQWLAHPSLPRILTHAQSFGMAASLHGEKISQVGELASQFSSLRILVGGLGSAGYLPAVTYELLREYPNLSINLSGVIWAGNYVLHEWTERLGQDRLFFATGYPLCNPAGKLSAVRWELRHQTDSAQRRIFNENARILTGAEGRLG